MWLHVVLFIAALHHQHAAAANCQTITLDTFPQTVIRCCQVGNTFQCKKLKPLIITPCSSSDLNLSSSSAQ